MGMFDWVSEVPEFRCKCGEIVDGWQSKDGPCLLEKIPYWKVECFYSNCAKCGIWYEFRIKEDTKDALRNFDLFVGTWDGEVCNVLFDHSKGLDLTRRADFYGLFEKIEKT